MDTYENFKSKSKFLSIVEQYTNVSGQATASGAMPGALPGALPGTNDMAPTTTAAVSPALAKAQKDIKVAQDKAKAEQKKQAQAELNAIQTRMKELQKVITQK